MKPISHTGNEWTLVDEQADCAERSNAVYGMFYRFYEHTKWDREKNMSIPFKYSLTWDLSIHAPSAEKGEYMHMDCKSIAGQEKTFKTKEEMEKYLAGRIKAYDHLFQEEFPVVPKEYAEMFMFHGMVKPGYTIAEE